MGRNYLIHLNSSSISSGPGLFYAIYAGESFLMAACLIMSPIAATVVFRAKLLHLNGRLLIAILVVVFMWAIIARFVLLYYLIYDIPLDDTDILLTIANIARDSFFGYMCLFAAALGIDRLVATFFWRWYESGRPQTIIVLILLQLFLAIPSLSHAVLFMNDYIGLPCSMLFYAMKPAASVALMGAASTVNRRYLNDVHLSNPDLSNHYSLSKAFQLKENENIIQIFRSMFAPSFALNVVCMILYSLYGFLPAEFEMTRNVSIALFDFFISLYGVFFVPLAVSRHKDFVAELWKMKITKPIRRIFKIKPYSGNWFTSMAVVDTEVYFSQMIEPWKVGPMIVESGN